MRWRLFKAVELTIAALSHVNADVRQDAIWSLVRLGDARGGVALVAMLRCAYAAGGRKCVGRDWRRGGGAVADRRTQWRGCRYGRRGGDSVGPDWRCISAGGRRKLWRARWRLCYTASACWRAWASRVGRGCTNTHDTAHHHHGCWLIGRLDGLYCNNAKIAPQSKLNRCVPTYTNANVSTHLAQRLRRPSTTKRL
jgi:hypothetical protein